MNNINSELEELLNSLYVTGELSLTDISKRYDFTYRQVTSTARKVYGIDKVKEISTQIKNRKISKKLKRKILIKCIKNCKYCKKEFRVNKQRSKKIFCTRKCSSSRPKSDHAKQNMSDSAKRRVEKFGPSFPDKYKDTGFRSKTEYYFSKHLDELNVNYEYENCIKDSNGKLYFPDFYLPDHNLYVEVGLSSKYTERFLEIKSITGSDCIGIPNKVIFSNNEFEYLRSLGYNLIT